MLSKLATLTAAFVLALSAAVFASPVDRDGGEQTEVSAAADRVDLIGASDQDEQKFVLYLGPQEEFIPEADDRRVN